MHCEIIKPKFQDEYVVLFLSFCNKNTLKQKIINSVNVNSLVLLCFFKFQVTFFTFLNNEFI